MKEERSYDVLRMVWHGKRCECVSDVVQGETLYHRLRTIQEQEKPVETEQVFAWISQMLFLLKSYQHLGRGRIYRYLSPLCFIVLQDYKLALLDLETKENRDIIRIMERRELKEVFLPPGQGEYIRGKTASDYYALGKCVQFLLAATQNSNRLSYLQQRQLSKFISMATSLAITDGNLSWYEDQLQNLIPKTRKKHEFPQMLTKVMAVFFFCILAFSGFNLLKKGIPKMVGNISQAQEGKEKNSTGKAGTTDKTRTTSASGTMNQKKKKEEESMAVQKDQLYRELGFVQALELKNYEKAREYFGKMNGADELAAKYASICNYLAGHVQLSEQQMLTLLEDTDTLLRDNRDYQPWVLLFSGYGRLQESGAKEKQRALGEKILKSEVWKGQMPAAKWEELFLQMGTLYEELEENEKAIENYQTSLQDYDTSPSYPEICVRLSNLYLEEKRPDEALGVVKVGKEKLPENLDIRIQLLRVYASQGKEQRARLKQEASEAIAQYPKIQEKEEFQKILEEQGVKIKEGKVCIRTTDITRQQS